VDIDDDFGLSEIVEIKKGIAHNGDRNGGDPQWLVAKQVFQEESPFTKWAATIISIHGVDHLRSGQTRLALNTSTDSGAYCAQAFARGPEHPIKHFCAWSLGRLNGDIGIDATTVPRRRACNSVAVGRLAAK
jgi:hypothetical protein